MNLDPSKSAFDRAPVARKPLERMRKWLSPALKVSDQPLDPDLERRLRRPMITGSILIGVFVLGFLGWAILAPLESAVIAPGVVRVEENRKILRHREGGIVRTIQVREGEKVKKDQILLTMDDVQPRAGAESLYLRAEDLAESHVLEVKGRLVGDGCAYLLRSGGDGGGRRAGQRVRHDVCCTWQIPQLVGVF